MNQFIVGIFTALIVTGSFFGSLAQEANSLLWKISGKGIEKPSYLFGTIHLLPQEKYFFTDQMKEALTNSDVLALEADIDIPLSEQLNLAKEMMMPDGKTWKDFMTADEFESVRRTFVDSIGIKAGKFEKQYTKIRPIYASGLLLAELLGKTKMYEQELSSMAKKAKKPIIGLETIAEQMKIVSSISIEDQIEDVKGTGSNMLMEYNLLLDAYLSQNMDEMEELAKNEVGFDKMEAQLLTDRNNRWVSTIQEQVSEKSTFYAVGAMHLVGSNGLITQLRNAGYSVEAVN